MNKFIKKIYFLVLVFTLTMTSVSFAAYKELPTINWSADVLPMDDNNPFLDVPGVRKKIAQAITGKLHVL